MRHESVLVVIVVSPSLSNSSLREAAHDEVPRWDEDGLSPSPAPSVFPRQPLQRRARTGRGKRCPGAIGSPWRGSSGERAADGALLSPPPSAIRNTANPQLRPARRIFIADTRNLR
jgi:hypothetical protein